MDEAHKHHIAQRFGENIARNNAMRQMIKETAISNGELFVTISRDMRGVSHICVESKHHETFNWDRDEADAEGDGG